MKNILRDLVIDICFYCGKIGEELSASFVTIPGTYKAQVVCKKCKEKQDATPHQAT
jgi:hypothetical protein